MSNEILWIIILLSFSFRKANAEIRNVLNRIWTLTVTFFQIDIGKEIRIFTRHKVISEGLERNIASLMPNVGVDGGERSASRHYRFFS